MKRITANPPIPIADGETRANRNRLARWCKMVCPIADGETRANRNLHPEDKQATVL